MIRARRNRRRSIVVGLRLLTVLGVMAGGAANVHAQHEESTFQVVQLDPSARQAALGGSNPALSGRGAGSLFVNPALLSVGDHGAVELSYLNHVSDLSAGWASYARHVDGVGTLAGGFRYLSWGEIDRADESGTRQGTFQASDVAVTAGLSRAFRDGLRYGGALSVLHSSIDAEGATAFTLDAGAAYLHADSGTRFAVGIHNLGVVASSIGTRDDALPFDIRLGVSRRLEHLPLLVSIGAYRLDDLDGGPPDASAVESVLYHANISAEFQFSESFQVRFGYNQRRHDELKIKSRLDLAGFSTGVGIMISRVAVDYAFNSWSSLGGLHRFSVRTRL